MVSNLATDIIHPSYFKDLLSELSCLKKKCLYSCISTKGIRSILLAEMGCCFEMKSFPLAAIFNMDWRRVEIWIIFWPSLEKGLLQAAHRTILLYNHGPKPGKSCLVSAIRTTVFCKSVLAGGLDLDSWFNTLEQFIYVIFLSWKETSRSIEVSGAGLLQKQFLGGLNQTCDLL